MSRCLVTGGAGFIGSHIVDKLIKKGHQVTILDNFSTGTMSNFNKSAELYWRNIEDDLSDVFDLEFDYVFHLAAQINLRESIKNPVADAKTNIMGSLNIIQECHRTGVKKIVFASTGGAIYSPAAALPCHETSLIGPTSPYGLAKFTVENYLKLYHELYGLEYVALRFSNVYGARQNSQSESGVISIFLEKAINNEIAKIFGDGNQTRDYIYVKDVSSAAILAMQKNVSGIFNISTEIETSLNSLVQIIKVATSSNFRINYEPKINGELYRSCLSANLAKNILGWQPIYSLNKGLEETISYLRES